MYSVFVASFGGFVLPGEMFLLIYETQPTLCHSQTRLLICVFLGGKLVQVGRRREKFTGKSLPPASMSVGYF